MKYLKKTVMWVEVRMSFLKNRYEEIVKAIKIKLSDIECFPFRFVEILGNGWEVFKLLQNSTRRFDLVKWKCNKKEKKWTDRYWIE